MIADFCRWYIAERTRLLAAREAAHEEWRYWLRRQGWHPSPENDADLAHAEALHNRAERDYFEWWQAAQRCRWWKKTPAQQREEYLILQNGGYSYGYPSDYDNWLDAEDSEAAKYRTGSVR